MARLDGIHDLFAGNIIFLLLVLKLKTLISMLLQWMPFEEYVAQPFIQKHDLLKKLAEICSSKMEREYTGFSPVLTTTAFSQKNSYLYMNNRCLNLQD